MKYWCQLACCSLAVLAVSACSDSPSQRQQAEGDFDYLNESTVTQWKSPQDAKPKLSHEYDIPAGTFKGGLGEHVDIRPPQEVLALVPGVTIDTSPRVVTFWTAKPQIADHLWQVVRQFVESKQAVTTTRDHGQFIDVKGLQWSSDDEEHTHEAHYQFARVSQKHRYGVKISLLSLRSVGQNRDSSEYAVERYTMKAANKITAIYDAQMRESVSQAQSMSQSIPVSMGTDRSGLPVIIARTAYDNLWRRLPQALIQVGFSVEDRNRSQGTIKVKFSSPDDDVWAGMGVEPVPLSSGSYTILLGDLENRTSLNMTASDGKPVKDEVLRAFVPVMAALFK